jgi:hypothetical protein
MGLERSLIRGRGQRFIGLALRPHLGWSFGGFYDFFGGVFGHVVLSSLKADGGFVQAISRATAINGSPQATLLIRQLAPWQWRLGS